MHKKVSFSDNTPSISDIDTYYNDSEQALRLFFSTHSPSYASRFISYSQNEIQEELNARLDELDQTSSFVLLTSIEASFQIDYLQRNYQRKKDHVSQAMRDLYKQKGRFASLEEIFDIWKNKINGLNVIIGDLNGAFKFRNWVAHGRYLTPMLGKKYDYQSIYMIISAVFENIPFLA